MNIDGYVTVGLDREYDLTADALLAAMDRAEVHRAVIASVDRYLAVDQREGNMQVLRTAAAHRDRLIPSCSVTPWYGDRAMAEMARAVGEGARMLVLHPAVQGYQANDSLAWGLMELASIEAIPVYIHTGPPGSATPWQMVDLAERWPGVDFIMGHSGTTDFHDDVNGAAAAAPNLYIESSMARPWGWVNRLKTLGNAKGIMGSAAPLNDLVFEWEQMRAVLPAEAWPEVLGGNLQRLLEKRGAL
jgi:uncharacterized protein